MATAQNRTEERILKKASSQEAARWKKMENKPNKILNLCLWFEAKVFACWTKKGKSNPIDERTTILIYFDIIYDGQRASERERERVGFTLEVFRSWTRLRMRMHGMACVCDVKWLKVHFKFNDILSIHKYKFRLWPQQWEKTWKIPSADKLVDVVALFAQLLELTNNQNCQKKYPCSLVFFFSYLWNEFTIHWVIPIWRVNDFQVLSRQFISCNEEKRKYSFRITKKILIKHSMDKIHVVLQIKSISQF